MSFIDNFKEAVKNSKYKTVSKLEKETGNQNKLAKQIEDQAERINETLRYIGCTLTISPNIELKNGYYYVFFKSEKYIMEYSEETKTFKCDSFPYDIYINDINEIYHRIEIPIIKKNLLQKLQRNKKADINILKTAINNITDEERYLIIKDYCKECGTYTGDGSYCKCG